METEQDQTVDLLADSLAKQHEVSFLSQTSIHFSLSFFSLSPSSLLFFKFFSKVAVEIGNELDEHVSLLNSMEGGVDKTTGRVKQQNVKLMKFEDKVKVFFFFLNFFYFELSLNFSSFLCDSKLIFLASGNWFVDGNFGSDSYCTCLNYFEYFELI